MKIINKIAYIIYWNNDYENGVLKKILDSIKIWQEFNLECTLFILTRNESFSLESYPINKIIYRTFYFSTQFNRNRSFTLLFKEVQKYNPDIIYYRYQQFVFSYLNLSKKFPTIIEVNSDDTKEKIISSISSHLYNLATRNLVLKNAKGFIYVSEELSKKTIFSKFNKPQAVIGNGIDLERIHRLKPVYNETPKLVYIGSDNQPWQGIDKIMTMANCFPKWEFNIIGSSSFDKSKQMPNVHLLGHLRYEDYIKVFSKSDCAIGALALHRIGIEERSTLKMLEYVAHGLPVICAYKDTNFIESKGFILKLENKEKNIRSNINIIESFVLSWMGKRVARNEIQNLDAKNVEKKRLDFFQSLIEV